MGGWVGRLKKEPFPPSPPTPTRLVNARNQKPGGGPGRARVLRRRRLHRGRAPPGRSGRRLRAVIQNPPLAIRTAPDLKSEKVQVMP